MRVHVLSDLHLEFGPFEYPKVDADLVVVAGDLYVKKMGLEWLRENIQDVPVIYIMGNHEYYGEKIPRLPHELKKEAEGTNIHVLENDILELGGFRFFGSTLWTDMALHGDFRTGMLEAQEAMNDYRRILKSSDDSHFRALDSRLHHLDSMHSLRNFFKHDGDPARNVVITHHAPSLLSVPKVLKDDPVSCAYASNLDSLIEVAKPVLWIHGHLHHSLDYRIGATRILANPRGYVDEKANPKFDPELVLELM